MLFLIVASRIMSVHGQHPVPTIRLDPDSHLGGRVGDFFEKVEVIPLETTPQSLFGRIYQMAVTERYFIIQDRETDAVLIFHRDGRFHAKIGKRKEKEYIGFFALDRSTDEIVLPAVSGNDNLLLFYNYEGNLLREQMVNKRGMHTFAFGKGLYAIHPSRPSKRSESSEISYDVVFTEDFQRSVKNLFPYDRQYQAYDGGMPFTFFSDQGDGSFHISPLYTYSIFSVNRDGINQGYRFVFPEKYSLPQGFSSGPEYAETRKGYILDPARENYDRIKELSPSYRHGDWLLFHARKIVHHFSDDAMANLMYNIRTGELYSLSLLLGDSVSNHLPILQRRRQQEMVALYGGSLYTSMPAGAYVKMLEELRENGKQVTSLPKVGKKDNPVLIRSVFKIRTID